MSNLKQDTTVNIRLSTDLLESLKDYARNVEERTVSDVVRRLVISAISNRENSNPS